MHWMICVNTHAQAIDDTKKDPTSFLSHDVTASYSYLETFRHKQTDRASRNFSFPLRQYSETVCKLSKMIIVNIVE